MKKIIIAAAAALLCAGLCGCSEAPKESGSSDTAQSSAEARELSISEKTAKLLEEVEFPQMVELDDEKMDVFFGIDKADVEEYSAYMCGTGAAPDEFGAFTAKDAEGARKISDALKARKDSQYETFESYTPAAMYRFDDCFITTKGNTVYYAVCSDNAKAKEIFGI